MQCGCGFTHHHHHHRRPVDPRPDAAGRDRGVVPNAGVDFPINPADRMADDRDVGARIGALSSACGPVAEPSDDAAAAIVVVAPEAPGKTRAPDVAAMILTGPGAAVANARRAVRSRAAALRAAISAISTLRSHDTSSLLNS